MGQKFKKDWNQFMGQHQACFLQSCQWGEFQESLGRSVWYLSDNYIKGLFISHQLPLGRTYLYCPQGPVIRQNSQSEQTQEELSRILNQVRKIAQKQKSIFLKLEPRDNFQLSAFSFQFSKKQIQPQKTIVLNLQKSEDELLRQMHPKTRYNIRLAAKKGVRAEFANGQSLIGQFIDLQKQTAQRDNFRLYPDEYYSKLVSVLEPENMVKLLIAKYQNKIIAANLLVYFNQTVYYLYGASDYNYRQLMAPYLLQWEAIKQAQRDGYSYYDFWGIDEQKWPGVTRFKRGFNGREITYPGAYDLVFSRPWYWLYNLAKKIL